MEDISKKARKMNEWKNGMRYSKGWMVNREQGGGKMNRRLGGCLLMNGWVNCERRDGKINWRRNGDGWIVDSE